MCITTASSVNWISPLCSRVSWSKQHTADQLRSAYQLWDRWTQSDAHIIGDWEHFPGFPLFPMQENPVPCDCNLNRGEKVPSSKASSENTFFYNLITSIKNIPISSLFVCFFCLIQYIAAIKVVIYHLSQNQQQNIWQGIISSIWSQLYIKLFALSE